MKRAASITGILSIVGLATALYFQFGVAPEVKRESFLKKGRDYIQQSTVNEAIIEFKNPLKADPTSAEGHHELGLALLRKGDYRSALREFGRATDLKPDLIRARYGRDRKGKSLVLVSIKL